MMTASGKEWMTERAPSKSPASMKAFRMQTPMERGEKRDSSREESSIPTPRAEIRRPNAPDPS